MNAKKYTYNGEKLTEYEASQKQRAIERNIRRWKREYKAMEAAGLDTSEAASKLTKWQDAQKDFLSQTGLKRQAERERVEGFGRSEAAKAGAFARKETARSPAKEISGPPKASFEPEAAKNSLTKRLDNSSGSSDNIAMLRYYAQSTDYVMDPKMPGSIAYDPVKDAILYNPNCVLPNGVDVDGILSHELAHRSDALLYHVSDSPEWVGAVKRISENLIGMSKEIEGWFSIGGKYADDPFISDIMSAIFGDSISLPYGHSERYWSKPLNREKEIFANMSAMDLIGSAGGNEFNGILRELRMVFLDKLKG